MDELVDSLAVTAGIGSIALGEIVIVARIFGNFGTTLILSRAA